MLKQIEPRHPASSINVLTYKTLSSSWIFNYVLIFIGCSLIISCIFNLTVLHSYRLPLQAFKSRKFKSESYTQPWRKVQPNVLPTLRWSWAAATDEGEFWGFFLLLRTQTQSSIFWRKSGFIKTWYSLEDVARISINNKRKKASYEDPWLLVISLGIRPDRGSNGWFFTQIVAKKLIRGVEITEQ